MISVISERRQERRRYDEMFQLAVAERQVVSLGSLLPGVATSQKSAKSIQRAVKKIDFTKEYRTEEEEEQRLPSTDSVLNMFGLRDDGMVGVRG